MIEKKKKLDEIDAEILKAENFIKKFKSNIPIAVLGGILLSFAYPYIPRRHGRGPMIESWEYSNAVLLILAIYFSIYLFSFFYLTTKNKKKIESLKRSKISISNKIEPYKSTKNFEST